MRVEGAINIVFGPSVLNDMSSGLVNVRVLGSKVFSQGGTEALNRPDVGLLGKNIDSVLDGISGDNGSIVGLGIGDVNLAFQKNLDGQLNDFLLLGVLGVALDFENTDIVLAIGSSRKSNRHDECM